MEPQTFRLQKIAEIEKELKKEKTHGGTMAKKYKRARAVFCNSGTAAGSFAAILSCTSLAVSLTGIGIVVGVSLAGVAGLSGMFTAVWQGIEKHLQKKLEKHVTTVAYAEAILSSITDIVSQALSDNHIDKEEFDRVRLELDKYYELKKPSTTTTHRPLRCGPRKSQTRANYPRGASQEIGKFLLNNNNIQCYCYCVTAAVSNYGNFIDFGSSHR